MIWEEIDLGLVEYSFTTLKFRMVMNNDHYQVSPSSISVVNEIVLHEGLLVRPTKVFLDSKELNNIKIKPYRYYIAIFLNVGYLKFYSLVSTRH